MLHDQSFLQELRKAESKSTAFQGSLSQRYTFHICSYHESFSSKPTMHVPHMTKKGNQLWFALSICVYIHVHIHIIWMYIISSICYSETHHFGWLLYPYSFVSEFPFSFAAPPWGLQAETWNLFTCNPFLEGNFTPDSLSNAGKT